MDDQTTHLDLTRLRRTGLERAANHGTLERRTSADTDGEVSRVLRKLEATGQNYTILELLANASTLFRPFIMLSNALNHHSVIEPEVRETLILAAAARSGTEYEWAEHVPMAQEAGLSEEQIAALCSSPIPVAPFGPTQRLALRMQAELAGGGGLSAATWQESIDRWGASGAIEIVAIVGWWDGFVRIFIEALGLTYPDDGRPGRRNRA